MEYHEHTFVGLQDVWQNSTAGCEESCQHQISYQKQKGLCGPLGDES